MALVGPHVERLLRQIAGFRFAVGEREGELVQRTVITAHQTFKVRGGVHIGVIGHVRCENRDYARWILTTGHPPTCNVTQTLRPSKRNFGRRVSYQWTVSLPGKNHGR